MRLFRNPRVSVRLTEWGGVRFRHRPAVKAQPPPKTEIPADMLRELGLEPQGTPGRVSMTAVQFGWLEVKLYGRSWNRPQA